MSKDSTPPRTFAERRYGKFPFLVLQTAGKRPTEARNENTSPPSFAVPILSYDRRPHGVPCRLDRSNMQHDNQSSLIGFFDWRWPWIGPNRTWTFELAHDSSATIRAMISAASCLRLRPSKRSANASASARS